MKHLYRSSNNKIFAGIFGGLGEYYNTDPVLLRAGFVLLTIITGIIPCTLAYIICRYIIPKKPNSNIRDAEVNETKV
jgi:phage shock protein C